MVGCLLRSTLGWLDDGEVTFMDIWVCGVRACMITGWSNSMLHTFQLYKLSYEITIELLHALGNEYRFLSLYLYSCSHHLLFYPTCQKPALLLAIDITTPPVIIWCRAGRQLLFLWFGTFVTCCLQCDRNQQYVGACSWKAFSGNSDKCWLSLYFYF